MYSFDLEKKVLAGLLQHQEKWGEISSFLIDDDFYSEDSKVHISLFKLLKNALNNAEAIDDTILIDRIKNLNVSFPDSIDMEEYIRALQYHPVNEKVFENAVRELKKYTLRRKGLEISNRMTKFVTNIDPSEPYSSITEGLDKIYNDTVREFECGENKVVNLGPMAEQVIEYLGENPPTNTGLMSPYETVNKIYGSLVKPGNCCIIAARAKCGKELANYEKVLTPDGWVNHGDIKVGDRVVTPSGRISNVTDVFPHLQKDVYRFTFADGRVVDAGLEHLWMIWGRHDGGCWKNKVINTEAVIKMLACPSKAKRTYIPLLGNIFEDVDLELPIDPYCLGALLGDGTLTKSISIDCGDPEVLDIIRERMKCGKRSDAPGCERTRISNFSENYKFFEESGLKGTKSGSKFIPEVYLKASRSQKLELIRGLFDTDGYASEKGGVEFYTKSRVMAYQIQEILWSLGCVCKITEKIPTIYGKEYDICYRMHIRHETPSILFSLERKKARLNRGKACRLRIESVVKLDKKEDCSCIQIDDPEHLYITSNYIVTHNTTMLVDMATKMAYKEQVPILHFDNGEMSAKELVMRMVSSMSGVPMYLLESGKWRKSGYKDWTPKEVVDRVRSVWDKTRNIKILYENVAGMDVEEMKSLMKRIYYSEVGRGKPMTFSFDYLKTDFNNLGKGADWAFAGRTLHLFKQCIARELVFDGEPTVGMLTSVQTNRQGIVSSKKGLDAIVEDESVVANADQYIQFASHLFLLRKKVIEEIVDEGEEFGTHKLICLAARHLGEDAFSHINPVRMADGSLKDNFINLKFDSFNVEDCGDLAEIQRAKNGDDVIPVVGGSDDDDDLPI